MNPLHVLDRLMEDYASPKVRRTVHSLLLLVAFGVTTYLAFEGDWRQAALAAAAAIYTWANRANTEPEDNWVDHLPTDAVHGGEGVSGNDEYL